MSDESPLGPLQARFEVDPRDQRSVAWVRGVSALLAGGAALLVLAGSVSIPVFMAALLGLLMAFVWWRQATRARKLARVASSHHLAIYQHGFVIGEGDRTTQVRFADLEHIDVDEEHLDIVALFRAGRGGASRSEDGRVRLRIEPRYPGVAIHDLVRTLQDAARADSHHVRES